MRFPFLFNLACFLVAITAFPGCSEKQMSRAIAVDNEIDDKVDDAVDDARVASTRAVSNRSVSTRPVAYSSDQGEARNFDWPCWRGPHANGKSSERGLKRTFPDSLEPLWRVKLGTGFSGLSVADGRLFTMYGREGRERLGCFEIASGKRLWERELDDDFAEGRSYGPRSTPCVEEGRVYAVGASGEIRCVQSATGEVVWRFNIHQKYSMRRHDEGLSCSPVIDGNRLYLAAGNSAFAFNKTDGALIWRALEERMNHATPTVANLDGRRQLLVLSAENLIGLDPKSGSILWRHPQRAVNCSSPLVLPGDRVFIAAAYGFGSQWVEIKEGRPKQVFKNMTLATHHATAVLHNGHLFGFHDRPGIFKCVDAATGKETWVSRSPGKGKLIIADGQLIILTEYGELVLGAASTDGFQETTKAKLLEGTCYTAPTLANGKLFLRSDKEMVCLDMMKP